MSTPAAREYLAEQAVEAEFVPLGYHRDHGRDLGLKRDIDVLFIGDLAVGRRRQRSAGFAAPVPAGRGQPR